MKKIKELYSDPGLYDIYYNPNNESPLRDHYQEVLYNKQIKTIFDCSIGTGNLTFALHDLGYEISGSDISKSMLEKASEKCNQRKIEMNLYESDFRYVNEISTKKYDCIMSTGNSLPHVTNEDVMITLAAMSKMIDKDGYLYFDVRNWDMILDKRERFFLYNPHIDSKGRTNIVLVKDYLNDNRIRFNFLYSFEKDNKIIRKEERTVEYYPIKKDLIINKLKELGFCEFELFNFVNHKITEYNDMEWYSIICKKN